MASNKRLRGTGCLYLPKGSSVWMLCYHRKGAKVRESSRTRDRYEAETTLRNRIASVKDGTWVSPKALAPALNTLAVRSKISELRSEIGRLSTLRGHALHRTRHKDKPQICSIRGCGSSDTICYDHCHTTGAFRGWICRKCNAALGFCDDNPSRLRALADYLESWQVAPQQ